MLVVAADCSLDALSVALSIALTLEYVLWHLTLEYGFECVLWLKIAKLFVDCRLQIAKCLCRMCNATFIGVVFLLLPLCKLGYFNVGFFVATNFFFFLLCGPLYPQKQIPVQCAFWFYIWIVLTYDVEVPIVVTTIEANSERKPIFLANLRFSFRPSQPFCILKQFMYRLYFLKF